MAGTLARLDVALHATGEVDEAAACHAEVSDLLDEMRLGKESLYLPPWYGGAPDCSDTPPR